MADSIQKTWSVTNRIPKNNQKLFFLEKGANYKKRKILDSAYGLKLSRFFRPGAVEVGEGHL